MWHGIEGTLRRVDSVRYVAVAPELRYLLLDLHPAQGWPDSGRMSTHLPCANCRAGNDAKCLNRAKCGRRAVFENLSKRTTKDVLSKAGIAWGGYYSLRRFHGTGVREKSGSSDTASKALGNTKDVADSPLHQVGRGIAGCA